MAAKQRSFGLTKGENLSLKILQFLTLLSMLQATFTFIHIAFLIIQDGYFVSKLPMLFVFWIVGFLTNLGLLYKKKVAWFLSIGINVYILALNIGTFSRRDISSLIAILTVSVVLTLLFATRNVFLKNGK